VLLVLFGQLPESDEQLLLVSLEELQVRIDEISVLFLGESVLELLQLDSLLLLSAVLIQSVKLTIIEFEEKVVGVDETLAVVVLILVLFAVHFCEA